MNSTTDPAGNWCNVSPSHHIAFSTNQDLMYFPAPCTGCQSPPRNHHSALEHLCFLILFLFLLQEVAALVGDWIKAS